VAAFGGALAVSARKLDDEESSFTGYCLQIQQPSVQVVESQQTRLREPVER
jgi:hypothetical protein